MIDGKILFGIKTFLKNIKNLVKFFIIMDLQLFRTNYSRTNFIVTVKTIFTNL